MSDATNKLGHKIRNRGARTRRALLTALRSLLNTRHLGEIRPADVAQAAGVSAPTFYTYFKSVEEGLLVLCEEAGEDFQRLARHIHADWTGDRGFDAVRAYVLEVLSLWEEHGPVLRVEHMLADMGEPDFAASRIKRLRRLHLALERRIAQAEAQASAEVKAAAADLAARAAEQILTARLASQKSDPQLDAAIAQLGSRLN